MFSEGQELVRLAAGESWTKTRQEHGMVSHQIRSQLAVQAHPYRQQLKRYQQIFSLLEDHPISLALYYPLQKLFYEIN